MSRLTADQTEQRVHRRDGGVVVGSEGDAAFQGAPQRIDAGCAGFPKEDVPVAVAPVIGVHGEEGRNHAEPFDAVELILADCLAMDDDVWMYTGVTSVNGRARA